MNVLSVYYDHWGREQNRLRHQLYQRRVVRRLMSKLFFFSVIEMDEDPRPMANTSWGYLPIDARDFWYWMRFVVATWEEPSLSNDPRSCFSNMDTLANLLFPTQSPTRLSRTDVGTPWEHLKRRRRHLCRLNALSETLMFGEEVDTLERVNALIALPPLNF